MLTRTFTMRVRLFVGVIRESLMVVVLGLFVAIFSALITVAILVE